MYDCIIVGSGIAGLYVASLLKDARVLLLTKAGRDDSNTNHAQGGIAAALGVGDRAHLHWQDTLSAGAGLSDPVAAWVLVQEAKNAISDLVGYGVPFDRERGLLAMGQEAAHCRPRVLHAGGDATGTHIQATLGQVVANSANVAIREHHRVNELIIESGAVRGVVARDCQTGKLERHTGRAVVLATGGMGRLYQHTTNPPVATGAGLAVAYRAGASVADLEFCQFHPTVLMLPNAPRFLITEAARGEGGRLVNYSGKRFMLDYDARGELAPRHVVTAAILAEMAKEGTPNVYLDLSHLPADLVLRRFPTVAAFCRQHGLDITRSPIPVAPAAHYMMGGIRTNLWGETSIPALFACGEVACTGVHGANRLASNSLLEGLVFGARIARRMTGDGTGHHRDERFPAETVPAREVPEDRRIGPSVAPGGPSAGEPAQLNAEKVRALMWDSAGTIRSGQSLEMAARQLDNWAASSSTATSKEEDEHGDMLLAARLVVAAALARTETRGAHRRSDFPAEDEAWRRRLVFSLDRSCSRPGVPIMGCVGDGS